MGSQLLLERGIDAKKLTLANNASQAAKMLANERRFQVWSNNMLVAFWVMKKLGYDISEYEVVSILQEGHAYFALNKGTDDDIVKQLQRSLNEVKDSGLFR